MAQVSLVRRRTWPVVSVFMAIIAIQFLVSAGSIAILSAVRAYVTGESLYSKGQKDAQIHLLDFAQHYNEEDYEKFQRALSVPLATRLTREELQKPSPDIAVARRGILESGN